ncbi:MAG: type 4a pilus biogenesis protein PilO [Candidatus Yonathbacteria bacterium]|nr:type 4a pilus biogenesis protein PilO [Candidatus Yonathbacteria bacterium]
MERPAHFLPIVAFALALLTGGVYGVLAYNLFSTRAAIVRLELGAGEEEIRWRAARSVTRTMEETREERQEVLGRLLSEGDTVDMIGRLESAANHAGVKMSLQSLSVVGKDKDTRLSVMVGMTGSWHAVMYFMALVESLPMNITVSSVAIERSNEAKAWKGTMDFEIINFKN